jgi:hypothetical protein
MAASFAPRASIVPSQVHTNVVPGVFFEDIIEVSADTSYPTGGYPFTNTQLQAMYGGAYSTLVSVDVVNPWFAASSSTMFLAAWNKATSSIMAFAQAVAGAATSQVQVTATTNLSTGGGGQFICSLRIRFF